MAPSLPSKPKTCSSLTISLCLRDGMVRASRWDALLRMSMRYPAAFKAPALKIFARQRIHFCAWSDL